LLVDEILVWKFWGIAKMPSGPVFNIWLKLVNPMGCVLYGAFDPSRGSFSV
jgi:hypothetical protein